MQIVNLTPHVLNLIGANGDVLNVPTSGTIARLTVASEAVGEAQGITLYRSVFGELVGLPEPSQGVLYATSALVKVRAQELGREDVVSPGNPVRDENGVIIGANGLSF